MAMHGSGRKFIWECEVWSVAVQCHSLNISCSYTLNQEYIPRNMVALSSNVDLTVKVLVIRITALYQVVFNTKTNLLLKLVLP